MVATARDSRFQQPPADRYADLVATLPPRPLHDAHDYANLDIFRSLLAEHGTSGAELSRLLGASRSLGPMILRGDRSLTVQHARLLGDYFKLDPGVFIRW